MWRRGTVYEAARVGLKSASGLEQRAQSTSQRALALRRAASKRLRHPQSPFPQPDRSALRPPARARTKKRQDSYPTATKILWVSATWSVEQGASCAPALNLREWGAKEHAMPKRPTRTMASTPAMKKSSALTNLPPLHSRTRRPRRPLSRIDPVAWGRYGRGHEPLAIPSPGNSSWRLCNHHSAKQRSWSSTASFGTGVQQGRACGGDARSHRDNS